LVVTQNSREPDTDEVRRRREKPMKTTLRHAAGFAALAFAAAGLAAPAFAQSADEEIVVTAQKRSERLQDVPLAVSAFTGDQLEQAGIGNAVDLRYLAPSVNYGTSANTRGEGLQVRGVGTQIFGDGVEQSVGVVIDGVPMGRNGMGIQEIADIERIEVLRGPQGMLFGKNASAGLISVVTRDPVLGENSLALRGSYATLNDIQLRATGNVALGEEAALRISYASRERDGFIRNIARNEDLGSLDNQSIRAKFLAQVTPDLRFVLAGDWAQSDTLCCAWTARQSGPGTFLTLNTLQNIRPGPTNLTNAAGARFFQDQNYWGLSSQADWDLGFATLTGVASYRYWLAEDNNDPDILPINVLDFNAGDSEVDQSTFEIRLSSPGDQALEWTVGLFALQMVNEGGNTQAGTLGLAPPALPAGATLGNTRRSETKNESNAIFGQVGYTLADKFKVILGGRYTDESLAVVFNNRVATGSIASIPGRFVGSAAAKKNTTNTSWRVTAQYDFTDDVMAYATAARGYKGPAYDQNVVNPTIVFTREEIPTTYEIGFRSSLFGGSTIFNAAAFTTTFKDFQAQVFDQSVFPSRFATANAGELETQGVELEFRTRPTDGLTFSGNLAYVDAVFNDFKGVACYQGQTALPFGTPRTSPRQCINQTATGSAATEGTGNSLPNSPKWTGNFAANYERDIGGLRGFGGLSYFYRDDVSYSAAGDPNLRQDGYGLLGAQFGIGGQDERWRLTVFGRNLTDENFVTNIIPQPVLQTTPLSAPGAYSQFPTADTRRTVGVSLDVKFGG
jgi:iron complex outermembrane receptor protein